MRKRQSLFLFAGVAGICSAMLACAPVTPTPVKVQGNPPAPPATPAPAPAPQPDAEQTWEVNAEHFADLLASRSQPFAWDRITADNVDDVRVSIGGKDLPFSSSAYEPAFDSDISGAEWGIAAAVSPGAVVLEISAESQRFDKGDVGTVTITNPGSGYTSVPTVTFGAAPSGGTTATGTTVLAIDGIGSVTVSTAGSGYTSAPAVEFSGGGGRGAAGTVNVSGGVASVRITRGSCYSTLPAVVFSAPPAGGTTATGTAGSTGGCAVRSVTITSAGSGYTSPPTVTFSGGTLGGLFSPGRGVAVMSYSVTSVSITNGGSGYTSAPTVTFEAAPSGGTTAVGTATVSGVVTSVTITNRGRGYVTAPSVTFSGGSPGTDATATATLRGPRGNTEYDNLYWAQQALYGKQLRIRIEQD